MALARVVRTASAAAALVVCLGAHALSQSVDRRPPGIGVSLGAATYDSQRVGAVVSFAFHDDLCRNRPSPFLVELDVASEDGRLLAVPLLDHGVTAGSNGGRPIRGLKLGCGSYSAFWPDPSHKLLSTRGTVFTLKLSVDNKRVVFKGPIRF